jgi:hypothetical protein
MNGGSIFVLLVDNDAEFAAAAARSFESVGMRALVALDSSPYAHSLADNSIDVFVTDIKRESHGHKLVWMLKKWSLSQIARHFQPRRPSLWRLPSFAARSGFTKFTSQEGSKTEWTVGASEMGVEPKFM